MRALVSAVTLSVALAALVVVSSSRAGEGDAAADASAEKEAASRFSEGERAFSRGDYAKAGDAFEAAYAAKPHEAALWNAARSWERAGELARAANLYRRYLRSAPDDAPDKKRAASALDALKPKLGRLEIVAPLLPAITVDDRATTDNVVFVIPGTHLVVGKNDAGVSAKKEVTLTAGAIESVVLDPPPEPKPSAVPASSAPPLTSSAPLASAAPTTTGRPVPTPPPEVKRHGTTPWLLAPFIGVTAISGTFLIASGIDVIRAKSDFEELKKGRSTEEQQALIEAGVGKTDRTNVLIGVTGGLALVTGIVALTAIDWGGHDKPAGKPATSSGRVFVGPGGVGLEARF